MYTKWGNRFKRREGIFQYFLTTFVSRERIILFRKKRMKKKRRDRDVRSTVFHFEWSSKKVCVRRSFALSSPPLTRYFPHITWQFLTHIFISFFKHIRLISVLCFPLLRSLSGSFFIFHSFFPFIYSTGERPAPFWTVSSAVFNVCQLAFSPRTIR